MGDLTDHDDPPPACPMCNGPGLHLGVLGPKVWFRCRNCGWMFYLTDTETPTKTKKD